MKPGLPLRVYFENAAALLQEDPAGFLRVTWKPAARQPQDTRAVFMHMMQAISRNNWSRILIDQGRMVPFAPDEQEWVAREWLPRAVEAGYRHGAVVVSADVMVRLATAYITTQAPASALVYRSFETDAEAVEWLLQHPRSAAL
ncbi:hypothetical protein KBK19_18930 [Microvirga sp. STR05]|uniref:STAS/SEC14 domain-containing protein n=1 Tax=Hymenobacter duratus TaxID=2771356 RepID=A0ABR8JMK7_9BACT|nr:hypothetical protein [Hymenobacter duratus]MBD2717125.1 hypothetical protein [Hymenobacter duratus]MBR7952041.1 hypothetical protein [Microvirga sp. STR05]